MIRINLLPIKQIKQRIKTRNELLGFIGLFLLVLAAVGFVGFTMVKKIEGLNAEVATLQAEKRKYDSVIRRIKKIQKEQKLLETKMQVIENLKGNSQLPVRVMDEVANITHSDRMWLQSFSFSGGKITLSGVAMDNATIAQYMKRVDNSEFFTNADLKNTSMTTVASQKLKAFSLSAEVKQPDFGSDSEKEKNKK